MLLPLPRISPADVETARQIAARHRDPKAKQPTFLETVKAYKVLDVEARQGKPDRGRGPGRSRWATTSPGSRCPARSSSSWGWPSSKTRRSPHTIIAELANGSIGYIPTRRAYVQGNYEVVSARCAEGSGELLVDTAIRLLKDLHATHRGATATSNRPGSPGRGWPPPVTGLCCQARP